MMKSKAKKLSIIKQKKLLIAAGVIIWVFLFITTVSKSYFWSSNLDIEINMSFLISKAFWMWTTIGLFSPLFVLLARLFYQKDLAFKATAMHMIIGVLLVPVYSCFYLFVMMLVWYTEVPWTWEFFNNAIGLVVIQFSIIGPLSYWLVVGAWYFRKYYEDYLKRELNNAEIESELSSMRLQVLKAQLHPHFLFNTLHNINSLIYENVEKAEQILLLLKKILQVSITRVNEYQVLLVNELEFTNAYLEIEKTRFSDRLIVESHIDPDTLQVMVPSFLLQPLVENAIRHGIAKKASVGIIRITSKMEHERLVLSVEDSGPGLVEGGVSSGIGLSNIEERLNHLYDKYIFSLLSSELGGLKVLIEFPVNDNL